MRVWVHPHSPGSFSQRIRELYCRQLYRYDVYIRFSRKIREVNVSFSSYSFRYTYIDPGYTSKARSLLNTEWDSWIRASTLPPFACNIALEVLWEPATFCRAFDKPGRRRISPWDLARGLYNNVVCIHAYTLHLQIIFFNVLSPKNGFE